ncbi:MAG: DNA polymerase III subunit delta' [uncultured bacterium]|nr:MAG: DNA polymerase III subunit delta' [uncultured bacterium]
MHSIYPWQKPEWQQLIDRKDNGQLPHALLIKGMEGLGKYHFAQSFAEMMLCQKGGTKACGECSTCQLLKSNNHPDLMVVRPEEPGKAIKIDQIRELVTDLNNTSQQGGHKIVIIDHAELLNIAASNALLKTLEEPGAHVIIILISSHPAALSATIRSRCQAISIKAPSQPQAEEWLKQQALTADPKLVLSLAENAPLKALDLAKEEDWRARQEFFQHLYTLQNKKMSSVQVAEHCLDWDLKPLLLLFMHLVTDLVKIKLNAVETIVNQDQAENLVQLAAKITLHNLLAYQTQLFQLQQHLVKNINLNKQLTIENLIITWTQLFGEQC